jgi:hypothetical protein
MHQDVVVIKQGTFRYADTVVCDIRIIKTHIRYGTGDDEDPPEIANDIEGEFYDVEFGSTTQRDVYLSSMRGLPSLDEAICAAEQAPGVGATLHWFD